MVPAYVKLITIIVLFFYLQLNIENVLLLLTVAFSK